MVEKHSLSRRFDDYRPTKTLFLWSCAGCVVATMIVGFAWGGWVTGGTASQMAVKAAADGRAALAATICVDRFASSLDSAAALVSLKATDSWKREDIIAAGGWAKLPGMEKPVPGSAELCAKQLADASPAPVTAAQVEK
jgi:hypothetical protein